MRECPMNKQGVGNQGNKAQSSLVAPLDRAAPRRATSGSGVRENRLYAITIRQEQENSPNFCQGYYQSLYFYFL